MFAAIEATVQQTSDRQVIWLPYHLNSPAFASEAVRHFREITGDLALATAHVGIARGG